jgi:hypothetical protein
MHQRRPIGTPFAFINGNYSDFCRFKVSGYAAAGGRKYGESIEYRTWRLIRCPMKNNAQDEADGCRQIHDPRPDDHFEAVGVEIFPAQPKRPDYPDGMPEDRRWGNVGTVSERRCLQHNRPE